MNVHVDSKVDCGSDDIEREIVTVFPEQAHSPRGTYPEVSAELHAANHGSIFHLPEKDDDRSDKTVSVPHHFLARHTFLTH